MENRDQKNRPTDSTRRRLIGYRYPTELWLLVVTLLVIGLALFSSSASSFYGLAIFFVIATALNYLVIQIIIEGFKRDSVQVSETQFPELKKLVDECRQHIDIPPDTKVFVSYSPYMNAFAMGLGRPYTIVLFSALVDNLDRDELKYVIGHEMGHIQFGHTVLLTLIGQLGTQTYGLPLLRTLFHFFFLFWSRAAEMSADRAGLVGNGRLDKAISVQVKFGAGPLLARWADPQMLARQARETRISFLGAFIESFGTHPTLMTRIRRMVDFAASETYRQLRPDASSVSTVEPAFPSADFVSRNGSGATHTRRLKQGRVIRRIGSKVTPNQAASTIAEAVRPDTDAMFESTSLLEAEETEVMPSVEPSPPDLPKEIGFQRLNVAAIRANAEQADVWLRLGELLQSYSQAEQATACVQRARALIDGSTSSTSSDQLLFSSGDLALVAGQSPPLPAVPAAGPICPKCGTANPTRARYCFQCQASLQRACLQCGAWLPTSHPNCTSCGQNQAQVIASLKAEAETLRQEAQEPLPQRGLAWWEIIYGLIFLIDIGIVLLVYADQTQIILYIAGASLLPLIGIIAGIIWFRRRIRRYWRVFDGVEVAVRRYNEIADMLAQQNITLDPARLTPKDPWRWT